ncbi:methylmalonyl-CoA mutase [miscellaneous Crenarchaeota group-15 archaeon DG-45]|uniref:Methylmalonyl-CoA mutase n=1 Tax=miscellaneous Crenarchaeota group-15 archaeon DG-45 TaxID=1685127 RepID=A0A0M0BME7_9ARCH|nr:MAG: methylmalonyl-CoA mutase [miscellaneous Crenarchaeota group-15 archaeon DG-45]
MFNKQRLSSLRGKLERWETETVEPGLSRFPERAEAFTTPSGRPVKRLYTPLDIGDLDYVERLGFPGEPPFTRGIYPTMYRGRLWTMRQYSGYASAEETNRRFKFLLEQGQTGLSVAFDLPTQTGYDSDSPMAEGEVGRVGVPISSLEDMERLFEGIDLGRVSTSMTINATAPQVLAMYLKAAEVRGTPPAELRGTAQNDLLKEYVARGTYIYPPAESMRLVVDIIEHFFRSVPRFNTISVSGYHMREAGATAAQELAFTLANGIEYVRSAVERGLPVDAFAPRISFFFGCHNDFLEEIAKFRAARRMWAAIMRDRFEAESRESMLMRYHVQTDGVTLTAQQPYNNIARVTIQGLAAVLGGCQSLHTNSFDEALGLPSEVAVTTALRTQQIIAHESGVAGTIDPLGGAYAVECLTDEIEEEAYGYIDRIEVMGGATAAIDGGFYQREISESAYRQQRETESGDRVVVGVNAYAGEERIPIEPLRVDPVLEKKQIERLRAFKARRERGEVERALGDMRRAAEGDENLMPYIIEAVEARATNGEISDTLRGVFGEYRAATIV